MEIMKPQDVMRMATPDAIKVIELVLKIEKEGQHYKKLSPDLEKEFCERIIKVIKDQVKS